MAEELSGSRATQEAQDGGLPSVAQAMKKIGIINWSDFA
jgi:hypothetical protein